MKKTSFMHSQKGNLTLKHCILTSIKIKRADLFFLSLTDGIFETGAYQSQNQPFWVKVVHVVPNVQTLAGHTVGTIHLAPTTTLNFDTVLKT